MSPKLRTRAWALCHLSLSHLYGLQFQDQGPAVFRRPRSRCIPRLRVGANLTEAQRPCRCIRLFERPFRRLDRLFVSQVLPMGRPFDSKQRVTTAPELRERDGLEPGGSILP